MVARYGGEEFAVLLPNTDMRGVLRAFAKIRRRVEETTCNINGEVIKIPTFSAGLAEYRAGETPSHLIERADSALYRAKRLGRNRIEVQPKEGFDDSLEESVENESF
jgi:diguanylate cyclase